MLHSRSIAFEMRYTHARRVRLGSLGIPTREEPGIPGQLAAKNNKHIENTIKMKKTIIALMALAGVAAAAPNELGISTGGNFWGGDFTLTFTLNEGALSATDTTDVLALYWGTFSTGDYYANGITLTWSSDSEVSLYIGDGAMASVAGGDEGANITENTSFNGLRGATFGTKLSMGETYTLVNVGGDGNQTVSLYSGVSANGVALETVNYNGNMNGGNADTTMRSVVNAQYGYTPAVPEPTTATLSLLALAGLAARRRRK